MQGSKLGLLLAQGLNKFALQVGSEVTRTARTVIPAEAMSIVMIPTPVPGSPVIESAGVFTV